MKAEVIYPRLSYKVCGYLFEVHNALGRFRKEKEYADAFEIVLRETSVSYKRENRVDNRILGKKFSLYRLDFVIDGTLAVEIKAKPALTRDDYSQLKKYLAATGLKLGLLVNFQNQFLSPRRVLNIRSKSRNS